MVNDDDYYMVGTSSIMEQWSWIERNLGFNQSGGARTMVTENMIQAT